MSNIPSTINGNIMMMTFSQIFIATDGRERLSTAGLRIPLITIRGPVPLRVCGLHDSKIEGRHRWRRAIRRDQGSRASRTI